MKAINGENMPDGQEDLFMKEETKDWNKIVGANIRKYRIENHETQAMLGEYLGYEFTTIANYERGDRLPDLVTAYRIAGHYGIHVEDLMRERRLLSKEGKSADCISCEIRL